MTAEVVGYEDGMGPAHHLQHVQEKDFPEHDLFESEIAIFDHVFRRVHGCWRLEVETLIEGRENAV